MRVLLLVAFLSVLPGCLERRIQVTSEPPGASVWLNDSEVGRTPMTTGFKYYGVYDVQVRKEGFEPISTHRRARESLWEIPPFDLVATALPVTIEREVKWHFDLTPEPSGVPAGLVERAREMKALALPEAAPTK